MEARPVRTLVAVAGLILGAVVVASTLLGGQVNKVLSTVGSSVNSQAQVESGGVSLGQDGGGPAPTSRATTATGGSDQVADAAAAIPTLLIVRTGEVSLEVVDLDTALRTADAAVVRAGGYVSASSRAANGDEATATVTYRIPSAAWGTTLGALHALASRVGTEKIGTEEVSGQVVDLTARIANLRSTEAALAGIMARATKISDVLDVQKQLTTTRGDIEKLVAEKEHLQDRASFGSLTATFHLPPRPAPSATPRPTPTPARGWDPGDDVARASARLVGIGQTTTSVGIWLTIVGLPLLIGTAVLLVAGWQLVRLGRWLVRRRDRLARSEG
jgi:hypothetical protein